MYFHHLFLSTTFKNYFLLKNFYWLNLINSNLSDILLAIIFHRQFLSTTFYILFFKNYFFRNYSFTIILLSTNFIIMFHQLFQLIHQLIFINSLTFFPFLYSCYHFQILFPKLNNFLVVKITIKLKCDNLQILITISDLKQLFKNLDQLNFNFKSLLKFSEKTTATENSILTWPYQIKF